MQSHKWPATRYKLNAKRKASEHLFNTTSGIELLYCNWCEQRIHMFVTIHSLKNCMHALNSIVGTQHLKVTARASRASHWNKYIVRISKIMLKKIIVKEILFFWRKLLEVSSKVGHLDACTFAFWLLTQIAETSIDFVTILIRLAVFLASSYE